MIVVKTFPSLTVGESRNFGVNATFVRCLAGNASFRLQGYWRGELLLDFDGMMAGLAVGEISRENSGIGDHDLAQFDTFTITNGATAQTITLIYGDGNVEDNRLVGTVNITGGILSKPLGADTFNSGANVSVTTGSSATVHTGVSQGALVVIQNIGPSDVMLSGNNTMALGGGALMLKAASTFNGTDGGSIELSAGVTWYGRAVSAATSLAVQSTKFA
jgi:hypothetical protein